MLHLQQNRRVRQRPGPVSRSRRNEKEKKQKPACTAFAYDFLKQCFLPLTDHEDFKAKKSILINVDFFKSLQNLSALYKLTPRFFEEAIFPLNIKHAFSYIKCEMEKKQGDLGLAIFETNDTTATLVTYQELAVGLRLYYVPVEPLLMLHRNKKKSTFRLVLSVFSYLYHIVSMPLCNHNDYLSSCYGMIGEWLENEQGEWEVDDLLSHRLDIAAMCRSMKVIEKAIQNEEHLHEFENRLSAYSPIDKYEGELLNSVKTLFELYQQYPGAGFYDNLHPGLYTDEDEDRIYPEQYFSFCWNNDGWINDQLMEIVNCDLQEKSSAVVPCSIQYFKSPQATEIHQLEFETKLLDAICDFAEALNNLQP